MNTDLHFSSKKQDHETPQAFFDRLHEEFNFTLDAAATSENSKCQKFLSPENNALERDWGWHWCNICGWVEPKGLYSEYDRASLQQMQTNPTENSRILLAQERAEGRNGLLVQGLPQTDFKRTSSEEESRSGAGVGNQGTETPVCLNREGTRSEAQAVRSEQPQKTPTESGSNMGLDARRLAEVQGTLGSRVRLLRENGGGIDTGSLHPDLRSQLPRHGSSQHGSGVHKLQYREAAPSPARLVQGYEAPCPHCSETANLWTTNVFVNPPYGRGITGKWVKKAYEEALAGNLVVVLLPARTDTKFFHDIIMAHANEVRFIKGRLTFVGSPDPAPFPSMVVVFERHCRRPGTVLRITSMAASLDGDD